MSLEICLTNCVYLVLTLYATIIHKDLITISIKDIHLDHIKFHIKFLIPQHRHYTHFKKCKIQNTF